MIRCVLFLWLCLAGLAGAESLPALHDVTGVASDDVLNIRDEPDAGAAAVGSLPPDATRVEVVALSPDGQWGRVLLKEGTGWANMRYLRRTAGPDWFALQSPLTCLGNEPFWSLQIDPPLFQSVFTAPDSPELRLSMPDIWTGSEYQPVAGIRLGFEPPTGFVSLRGQACSDGMSDRVYGISADLFLGSADGAPFSGQPLSGCCMFAD